MNKTRVLLNTCLLSLLTVLAGCANGRGQSLPYDSWYLNFFSPDYMEAWVETSEVVDIKNRGFSNVLGGVVSSGYPRALSKGIPTEFKGNPKGWPKKPGGGGGKHVIGADLPRVIYVNWQSLVEPQTYEVYIEITEEMRQIMLKPEKAYCNLDGKWITDYRRFLTIGLAPGGIAKVWAQSPCLIPIEVTRVVGKVDPRGPYLGRSGGRYRPLSDISKAYVEKFGVPYGSW
ncbi:DUF2931 family protein [Pseudomonas indica]|uniref:DUF2931 family protein n=1 Tax=Pseudomonas indica TaxID=137658 RepID=A0A1G9GLY3_9PSED|nr:DUF2931 family protein [Pseudomonas indica]SDL01622.1 Protein of unknown function [Pseudomonas indica]